MFSAKSEKKIIIVHIAFLGHLEPFLCQPFGQLHCVKKCLRKLESISAKNIFLILQQIFCEKSWQKTKDLSWVNKT